VSGPFFFGSEWGQVMDRSKHTDEA